MLLHDDYSLQIDYFMTLSYEARFCHILEFSGKKPNCTIHFTMRGELIAFTDAFDSKHAPLCDLQSADSRDTLLYMLTDSKQAFDVIPGGKNLLNVSLL